MKMKLFRIATIFINNENLNNYNDKIQRNGVDARIMSQKPPRDPRSQIHIPEKLAHIDPSQNNIDLMNYENEVNQNRGNRSSSLSKLGEQNYKQMLDYPESNYHHQQDQIQYEEPININENQFHGFEDEEQAFRGMTKYYPLTIYRGNSKTRAL